MIDKILMTYESIQAPYQTFRNGHHISEDLAFGADGKSLKRRSR